jgi:hypothetical protein
MCSRWSLAVALLLLVLFGATKGTLQCVANEFPLWPFDDTAPAEDEDEGQGPRWVLGSRLTGLFRLRTNEAGQEASSNSWSEHPNYILGQNHSSAWQVVANTPRRMAGRVRSLWTRSLDLLTFDDREAPPTAHRAQPRRPLLGRIFGDDQEEATGPLTINEWMEQERPR